MDLAHEATKRLHAQLRPEHVDELLADLQTQLMNTGQVELDITALAHVERAAGALLTNALVGTLGNAPLTVRAETARNLSWFEASGLAFALAHRRGHTRVIGSSDANTSRWRRSWRPGSDLPWRELLAGDQPELFDPGLTGETRLRPNLYGPGYAAFVNPHLAASTPGGPHPLNAIVWPWLDRLLPRASNLGNAARQTFIESVGRLIDELVGNIAEHALRPVGPCISSLVQVSLTRGGRGSFDRIYLSVQDTGPGIAATARPKVEPAVASSLTEPQLITKLVEGTLAPWGRARGMGLPKVAEVVRQQGGVLRLASKMTRLVVDDISAAARASQRGFVLDGTVLTVMLRVPRA